MFKKIYLNEKAVGFVTEQLTRRVSLDVDIFSEFLSKSKLEIWGLYESDLLEIDLTEFQYGGKFTTSQIQEVTNLVEKYLEKDSQNRWMLLDNVGRTEYTPEQNEIKGVTKVFYYKDIVLHIIPKLSETFENILKTIKASGAYPFIGFITKFSEDIESRMLSNSVNDEDVQSMINNILLIIIGAYDEEGYLIVEVKKILS